MRLHYDSACPEVQEYLAPIYQVGNKTSFPIKGSNKFEFCDTYLLIIAVSSSSHQASTWKITAEDYHVAVLEDIDSCIIAEISMKISCEWSPSNLHDRIHRLWSKIKRPHHFWSCHHRNDFVSGTTTQIYAWLEISQKYCNCFDRKVMNIDIFVSKLELSL